MKVIYNSKEIGDNYNNYNRLTDKPLINSTELVGNITLNDINVYSKEEVKKLISSARSVKTGINLPSPLTPNTTYYIGPDMNGIYSVWLTDNADPINVFQIGTTSFGKYYSGEGIDVTDDTNIVSVLVDSESVIVNSEGLLEARPIFEKMIPFVGATATKDGSKGLVPKPEAGDQDKYLFGDGTWKSIADVMYPVGSTYVTEGTNTDPNTLFPGTTWVQYNSNYGVRTWDTGLSGDNIYDNVDGVPNIKGTWVSIPVININTSDKSIYRESYINQTNDGVFQGGSWYESVMGQTRLNINANRSSSIYGNVSGVVRPPSVIVVFWRRTA